MVQKEMFNIVQKNRKYSVEKTRPTMQKNTKYRVEKNKCGAEKLLNIEPKSFNTKYEILCRKNNKYRARKIGAEK